MLERPYRTSQEFALLFALVSTLQQLALDVQYCRALLLKAASLNQ